MLEEVIQAVETEQEYVEASNAYQAAKAAKKVAYRAFTEAKKALEAAVIDEQKYKALSYSTWRKVYRDKYPSVVALEDQRDALNKQLSDEWRTVNKYTQSLFLEKISEDS